MTKLPDPIERLNRLIVKKERTTSRRILMPTQDEIKLAEQSSTLMTPAEDENNSSSRWRTLAQDEDSLEDVDGDSLEGEDCRGYDINRI